MVHNLSHRDKHQEILHEMKPLFHWVGGKSRIAHKIRKYFPKSYNRYFEPFLGSGALFFSLEPTSAFLSDYNIDVIDAFIGIKENPTAVHEELTKLSNDETTYYTIRKLFNRNLTKTLRSAYLIYLLNTCYNGLYHVNKHGTFNTPYGKRKKMTLPSLTHIQEASKILKHAEIRHCHYGHALHQVREGDLVYLDPPYYNMYSNYTQHPFSRHDHRQLARWCEKINDIGATFVLSNIDILEVRQLYKNFTLHTLEVPHVISRDPRKRGKKTELVITNA